MRHYVANGSRLYLNPTAVIEEIQKERSRQAYYAGSKDNVQESVEIARRLCVENLITGNPDYRPEIYKKFL